MVFPDIFAFVYDIRAFLCYNYNRANSHFSKTSYLPQCIGVITPENDEFMFADIHILFNDATKLVNIFKMAK